MHAYKSSTLITFQTLSRRSLSLVIFAISISLLHLIYLSDLNCSTVCVMTTPINSANVYVPSDDDMSDILHNASHAYAMYLDETEKQDDNQMSMDQPVSLSYFLNLEIGKSVEMAHFDFSCSVSSTKYDIHICHSLCFNDD
jgi:hypothetical protein